MNSRCRSDSRRRARIASAVERPVVKPDCCGRRFSVRRGSSRARRIWAKTLPGTESKVMGLWLPHSTLDPLPLYRETIMPSRHSPGSFPDFQTEWNSFSRSSPEVEAECLRSSAVMPSEPGERPLLSLLIAASTSTRDGASRGIRWSSMAPAAACSRSGHGCAIGWLSAVE